jgi:hypothetical protein
MAERIHSARPLSYVLIALTFLVVTSASAPVPSAEELPDLELTDLWDSSRSLRSVAAQGTTLFFICDPGVKECREGAVFFESRASSMREAGIRPALIFRGKAPDVRSAVLNMDLDNPVYIDEDGHVIDSMLDQEVLPALLLAAPDGTVLKTVYGGGESLAGNIEQVIKPGTPEALPPQVARAGKEASGRWKYLVAAVALVVIGVVIFAE